jgi:flagellar M-ring protein FliF
MLELAGEGTLSQQAVWKWLEERNIFASQWDKQTRYRIALQQQLEMMIRKVDAVRNASVVVSPAEDGGLFKNSPKAKASVVIELHPGRELTSKNAQAIAGLVASAVPGLERDKVHITDSAGRPFRVGAPDVAADAAGSHWDYQRSIELDIERRLAAILPSMSFKVSVRAQMSDQKSRQFKRERPKAVEEEERRRTEKPSAAPSQGIKGDPTAPPPPPAPTGQDSELRTKYVFDETETQKSDPAGQIEKITVGVLYPVQIDKDGKEIATPGIPLEDVRTFVVKAAGPPCQPDDVSVIRVPTRAPEALPETAPVIGAFAWLAAHWTKIALFAFAVLGLAIMVRIVRGATAGGEVEEIRALATDLGQAVEAAVRPPEGEPRQGLREMVRQNPEAVAASLKSWMEAR